MSKTTKIIGIISAFLLIIGVIFIFINPEKQNAYFIIKGICGFSLVLAALFPMCVLADEDCEMNPVPMMILSGILVIGALVYATYCNGVYKKLFEVEGSSFLLTLEYLYGIGGYFGLMLVNNNEHTPEFLDRIPDWIKIPLTYILAPIIAVFLIVLEIIYACMN